MSKQATATTRDESAKSLLWQRPQVRRIDAGSAEGNGGGGTDNVVFS